MEPSFARSQWAWRGYEARRIDRNSEESAVPKMDHEDPFTHPLDREKLLESISNICPEVSESSFASSLLTAIALKDFNSEIKTYARGVQFTPMSEFEEKPGTVCAFEVVVELDKGNTFNVIEMDSSQKHIFLSRQKSYPRVILIDSNSIYVADAKWAVYKEFQYHLESENILLQHKCEDDEEVAKVCAIHAISSFNEKVKCLREAIPVRDISAIVDNAARKCLSRENIRKTCRETEIKSNGEYVGRVGSGSYETRYSPTVNRLKKVLVKETLKNVGESLSSEICKGILEHIQSKVHQNLEHNIANLKISISEEDLKSVVVAVAIIIVYLFTPTLGIIFAAITFFYTIIFAIDINSASWRNKVADEIHETVHKEMAQVLRKATRKIEEMCETTIDDLWEAQGRLEESIREIKPVCQTHFATEWKTRDIVQNAVDLNKYPSILKFIAGSKLKKPVVKVFMSHEDKETEKLFQENSNFPERPCFEFVNLAKKSKKINTDIERIRNLEKQAPAINKSTRKHLCELITKEANSIYANHSNVVSIGMSPVRFDGTNTPCITLYCLDKDLRPYGEKPLPKSINGYPCDIREDFVQLGCCVDCNVLNPGCCIGIPRKQNSMEASFNQHQSEYKIDSTGSAGFLFKSNDQSAPPMIGFLTAAHVAVAEYEELFRKGKRLSECRFDDYEYPVLHILSNGSQKFPVIGNVVDSFCGNRESVGMGGNCESVGMDAALVSLSEPRNKEHIILEIARESSLKYDRTMEVEKYGQSTKKTVGILCNVGESVSIQSKKNKSFQIFVNCYVIDDKEETFFSEGDSGSGVFLIDKDEGKLKPLGIAFALRTYFKGTFVCKIDKILEEFDISVIEEEKEEPMDTSADFVFTMI